MDWLLDLTIFKIGERMGGTVLTLTVLTLTRTGCALI
jgi:hypothetical protein